MTGNLVLLTAFSFNTSVSGTLLFVHLADPHDSCAADGARTLQTNELGAIRAETWPATEHRRGRELSNDEI